MRRSLLSMLLVLGACTAPASGPDGGSSGGTADGGGSAVGGGSAAAGGAAAGGSALPLDAGLPAWRVGLAKWQWHELPGTALSNQPVQDPMSAAMVAPTQRINAWNGLAANPDTNRVYLAGAGGHADWAGNEAYEIDLGVDAPRWRLLRGPSAGAAIVFGQNYYTDGRPSSTHLYYALQFVRARNRVFKLSAGSVWGSGNESNSHVDAFSLATNDWEPAGTYPSGTPHGDAIDRPYAQHPVTDDVYTFFQASFRRWNAATATWETIAPRPAGVNNDVVGASASAVDPIRQRVVYFRNAYTVTQRKGLAVTITPTPAVTEVAFTGPESGKLSAGGQGALFLPAEEAFLVKTGTAGEVLRVDASTFVTTALATTGAQPPNAVNGVYTRFLLLPQLRGIAYLASGSSNFWFLATE